MVSTAERAAEFARPEARGRAVLRWPEPVWDGLFEQLCGETDLLRFERSAEGDLIITALPGFATPGVGANLLGQVFTWADGFGGWVLGTSAGYALGELLLLSPDVSWLSPEQAAALESLEEQPPFWRACPLFVIEVRAKALAWEEQYGKMLDWMEHGCEVGLLVDWVERRVAVFRAGEEAVMLERPSRLEVDAERMPGLVLDFDAVWALVGG